MKMRLFEKQIRYAANMRFRGQKEILRLLYVLSQNRLNFDLLYYYYIRIRKLRL